MVGGDYIAHSTPGETRHSPKSDRAHVHTRNARVYRRIRVLNYSRAVRRWLDSTLHVCMFIRLQGSGCSAFLSLFPSLSIHPFRSVRSQCFLLRSPPSNVHLSRVSDEELIAPESLALLSSSQTDGPDMGRSSLFVRTWLPVSSSRRECARARLCGALHAGASGGDAHTHRVLPAARGESLGTESPQDLFAGQGCRVLAGNPIVR